MQVKFTSAVKLSEAGGLEFGHDEEETFFKRLGKWRSGRRNPSKVHHTEDKDGRPSLPFFLSLSVCLLINLEVFFAFFFIIPLLAQMI